jgi:hypothetical protein
MSQGFANLFNTQENLQYFTGSVTFTAATKTMAATGIESGLTVGDEIVVSGTVNNNGTFTIATLGTNTMTVNETVVNEGPVATTINQQVSSGWMQVNFYSRLVGAVSTGGNASFRLDFSNDRGVTTIVTLATAVVGGTPAALAQEVVAPWVNIRLRNNGADQTSVNCFMYGKGEV